MAKGTPMMAQYQAIKDQNPDCLLFFRLGDFYELFGDDAKEAAALLNITLTARSSGEGRSIRIPMAGIPFHSAPTYIQKLLRAGKKVAVCEQVSDPADPRAPIRRELVRVITPGTALEDGFVDRQSNNYIVALYPAKKSIGLAAADNSTGDFFYAEFALDAEGDLDSELARLHPAELLLPAGMPVPPELSRILDQNSYLLSHADSYSFAPHEADRTLKEHFRVASLEGFGLSSGQASLQAAGALLGYLKKTQLSQLEHVTQLRGYKHTSFMRLDASTQRNLELSANSEDGSKRATLFDVLDRSKTSAGGRMLKQWIHAPLLDLQAITDRHDAVAELVSNSMRRDQLGESLQSTTDIERVLGKVGCRAANARDLSSLRQSLRVMPELLAQLSTAEAPLLRSITERHIFSPLRQLLDLALVEDPPLSIHDAGMIRPGYSAELDQLSADSHGGRDLVLAVQEKERQRSGNPKLKVQFNNVFGFFIEVSKAQSQSVPADYERKQTLVNAERFTTPELKALETRVLGADEKRRSLEAKLFEDLTRQVSESCSGLLQLAHRLAELDALLSLASVAVELEYVRPEMLATAITDIEAGRHPVVEYLMRRQGSANFVANDCLLDVEKQQLMLITGPNMAGKSTYMRQIALIALMAQIGSFVPAKRARLGLVDRLFTRVGASDRLSRGMSTFLVEMSETANILRHATRQSLVILDEIGRGTSTYDGVSIAWAVAEHLHEDPQLGCRCLFATHYFELCELEARFPRVRNYSVAVREWEQKIIFLHQIKAGSSEHSYGIAVARLAGVPDTVLSKARSMLRSLELEHQRISPAASLSAPQIELFQESLSSEERLVLDSLLELDINDLTPIQALQLLHQWRQQIRLSGKVSR